jgi:hypothetical protein
VLGVRGRAGTVEEVSELVRRYDVEPVRWYGVWLFVDWLEFNGAELDPADTEQVLSAATVDFRGQPQRPVPPAQSRLPSGRTQATEVTGRSGRTASPVAAHAPPVMPTVLREPVRRVYARPGSAGR